ncbi:MAG: RICIN domain-containing protein [Bacteroidetes bacterium]|nr:RICIN domain-containing protein [Bacteroidota bacterium]
MMKRIFIGIFTVLFVAKSIAQGGAANPILQEGIYTIKGVQSNYFLTLYNGWTENNSQVAIYKLESNTNTQWELRHVGDNYYTMTNVTAKRNLNAIINTNAEKWVVVANATGDTDEQWKIVAADNSSFYIRNRKATLDAVVHNASTALNTRLILHPTNNGANQRWVFNRIADLPVPPQCIANGTYSVLGIASNLFMESDRCASVANNSNLAINYSQASDNQRWVFNHLGNNVYTIKSLRYYRYVTASAAGTNGSFLYLADSVNSNSQRWAAIPAGNGIFYFKNIATGRYMHVYNNATSSYSQLDIWDATNSGSQQWRLINYNSGNARSAEPSLNTSLVIPDETDVKIKEVPASTAEDFSVSPNPAGNTIRVHYAADNKTQLNFRITSTTGTVLKTVVYTVNKGQNNLTLDVSALSGGTYFVSADNGTVVKTRQIIIQH